MKSITDRFLELYEYLLQIGEVKNKADFVKRVDISPSMFTEISKGRTNVGLSVIQKTVLEFDWINSDWLLREVGSIDNRVQKTTHTPHTIEQNISLSAEDFTHYAPPTLSKSAPPTAPATGNLSLPKVVTVNENQEEVISLVSVKAAAGYLNGYADPEYIESLPTVRMPGLKGGSHRAFEVKGHSMSPTLYNSSIAVGRWVESLQDIRDRRIYIVVTKSEGIVVKRVINRIYQTGKLVLLSDNQNKRDYPNIILDPADVSELWYLRGAFIFEFPEPGELHQRFNDLEAKVTLLAAQMKQLQP